ncbi:hypothetical protein SNOG_12556 [Parastagonospora nodorum SN15]|uniref:Uncharacterized protein n=1 Tax=Phaeosphaeria nodorum (strain SN15 / ATCC MYA-4574 / FGSC 10173) TaxID=321614 RepID=Q0U6Q8_PHANO|nr:hypothetical protein SNOG_12556 [Parastagonospora nodorum SN15]EAT79854.1 hypothetical protein SNOG_12556 [Parastagonospora nodorum SN15]
MPIGNSEWRVDHELDATKKRADVLLVYSEPSKTEPGMVRWAGLLLEAGGCPGSTELVYRRIGGVVAMGTKNFGNDLTIKNPGTQAAAHYATA